MIKQTNTRNGNADPPHEVTPAEALETLVVYELGYGGHIVGARRDVDNDRSMLKTKTVIMGSCVDLTTFEGSAAEMELLLQVAYVHASLLAKERGAVVEATARAAEKMLGDKVGIPLLLSMSAGIISGEVTCKVTLLTVFGIKDPEEVKVALAMNLQDLLAALLLCRETGSKLAEVA